VLPVLQVLLGQQELRVRQDLLAQQAQQERVALAVRFGIRIQALVPQQPELLQEKRMVTMPFELLMMRYLNAYPALG
jgi:hypothetical protein